MDICVYTYMHTDLGFTSSSVGKNPPANAGGASLTPGSGRLPWRRKWQLTPVFLSGEFHGQRSLVGCSPRGHRRVCCNLATKQHSTLTQVDALLLPWAPPPSTFFLIPVFSAGNSWSFLGWGFLSPSSLLEGLEINGLGSVWKEKTPGQESLGLSYLSSHFFSITCLPSVIAFSPLEESLDSFPILMRTFQETWTWLHDICGSWMSRPSCTSVGLVNSGEHPTLFTWNHIIHRINTVCFEGNLEIRSLPSDLSTEESRNFWLEALSWKPLPFRTANSKSFLEVPVWTGFQPLEQP